MRFYFTQPGDPPDDGVEYLDTEAALREAAAAALAMAREQQNITEELRLDVSSSDGPVGSVTVKVMINRTG